MAQYPDYETYRKLYKRFYDGRSAEDLIEFAGSMAGKKVLDLCAGEGRLSLAAVACGAKEVWLLEQELWMLGKEVQRHEKIHIILNSVGSLLDTLFFGFKPFYYFDYIFCQQAVNYWLNENTVKIATDYLSPGGIFVFNTFNKKPSEIPDVKGYVMDGFEFVEISWLVEDTVHHVQIREGMPPHTTSFRWLSPEYLQSILSPHFSIEIKNEGNSSIYRCQKK